MRSRWKLLPTHRRPPSPRCRPQPAHLGQRLSLYTGRGWQSVPVREPMVGLPLSLFLPSKRGGAAIHRPRLFLPMGHSSHAVAFRLGYHRNWTHRSPFIHSASSLAAPGSLDRLLRRRFRPPQAPFLAANTLLRRSPFGVQRFLAPVQFTPLQRVLAFLHRRRLRRRPLHPLALASSPPPPPPEGAATPALASLWLPFLRFRFGSSWVPLLGLAPDPPQLRLLGVRTLPAPLLLCRFLMERVRIGLPLTRLVNSFLATNFRRLAKFGVLGVLLRASGRFTRSQLATTALFRRGRVPLATISLAVAQVSTTVPLKYGACTLTLWLSRLPPPPRP